MKNNKEYQTKYREENKDSRIIYDQKRYEENKEFFSKKNSDYYQKNKDRIKEKAKSNYENNKSIIKNNRKKYMKNRRANDINLKLHESISKRISGSIKTGSLVNILPYTIEDLKKYLEKQFESWMNWENYGKYNKKTWDDNDSSTWTWNIDHIIPRAKLIYFSVSDENFKKCWSLENLRPLSSKDNLIKGDK
jgi:hypothetical protein